MRVLKQLFIYGALIAAISVMIGAGFHTAEVGMQSMVGTDGPPKTIHIDSENQTVQVTVLGKQVMQHKLTLGDKWSRQLNSSTSGIGDIVDRVSFELGRFLQMVSQKLIKWVGTNTVGFFSR